jgi:hypothetical protein
LTPRFDSPGSDRSVIFVGKELSAAAARLQEATDLLFEVKDLIRIGDRIGAIDTITTIVKDPSMPLFAKATGAKLFADLGYRSTGSGWLPTLEYNVRDLTVSQYVSILEYYLTGLHFSDLNKILKDSRNCNFSYALICYLEKLYLGYLHQNSTLSALWREIKMKVLLSIPDKKEFRS